MSHIEDPATVETSLRLGAGLRAEEHPIVCSHWSALDARLKSFRADSVQLILSIKDRGTLTQTTTLEALIAGWPRMAVRSQEPEFERALGEVRDEMVRAISDAKNIHDPRTNKHRRDTIRHD